MGKKREESQRLGAVVFFLAMLFWLVVSNPWLLVFPLVYWLCLTRLNSREEVRRRPDRQAAGPAPGAMAAMQPLGTGARGRPSKAFPPPAEATPPDILPKDREYNRYLARAWDEEFAALANKREQVPPS